MCYTENIIFYSCLIKTFIIVSINIKKVLWSYRQIILIFDAPCDNFIASLSKVIQLKWGERMSQSISIGEKIKKGNGESVNVVDGEELTQLMGIGSME